MNSRENRQNRKKWGTYTGLTDAPTFNSLTTVGQNSTSCSRNILKLDTTSRSKLKFKRNEDFVYEAYKFTQYLHTFSDSPIISELFWVLISLPWLLIWTGSYFSAKITDLIQATINSPSLTTTDFGFMITTWL